ATSNSGSLPIQFVFAPTGTVVPTGSLLQSNAVSTVNVFNSGAAVITGPQCFQGGFSSNCILNGPANPGDTLAEWETSGFTTLIGGVPIIGTNTGPLTYFVDLNSLGLQSFSFDTMMNPLEAYIHNTLSANLKQISLPLLIVEDPGAVNLLLTNQMG